MVEIYSHHGQSEYYAPQHALAYEFNRMRKPERRANASVPGPFYAQDYWMKGVRIGAISSSDEHTGQPGRRHSGIAAVFADTLSRETMEGPCMYYARVTQAPVDWSDMAWTSPVWVDLR